MYKISLILILLFTIQIQSQTVTKKWKFNFQLDNRFSKIHNNEVVIFGAKIGMQYKNLTRFGIGASTIIKPVTVPYFDRRTNTAGENIINFWYISIYNDWIVYKSSKWECFLTEQIGYGKPTFIREVNNDVIKDVNRDLYVNEISGQVNYKILTWLGAGTGVGYRNLWNKKSALTNTFNAPIYIFKLIIYPESFIIKTSAVPNKTPISN